MSITREIQSKYRAVVRGGAGDALTPPEFEFSEKRTERVMDSQLLSASPKFENLTIALKYNYNLTFNILFCRDSDLSLAFLRNKLSAFYYLSSLKIITMG